MNYSSNYSMASGNMWNYYKDKVEQLNNWPWQFTRLPFQRLSEGPTTGAKFHINSAKHYVQTVTLSINDKINFLET